MRISIVGAIGAFLLLGADWPRFLGPTQNNVSPEKGILTDWPKDGLKVVWQADMGHGYAPPTIANGKLYHFDRFDNAARCTCRKPTTGEELWKYEYPTNYTDLYGYSPGPRACPVVAEGRVFLHGVEGMLTALDANTGKELWKVDTREEYRFHQNFFGVGSTPVVEGNLLLVAVGGSPRGPRPNDLREAVGNGTGIVAFDVKTGKEIYRTTDELASYSSPVTATMHGKRWAFYFARNALVGFDPETGKVRFRYPWRAKILESVNAANPLIVGNTIVVSECYGFGTAALNVKPDGIEEIWTDRENDRREKSLECHWNTPIAVDGFIYGSSGRHTEDADLRCIELATGKVVWKQPRQTRQTLLAVDGHLLALGEYGELQLLKINAKKFERVAKMDLEALEYPSWAPPVLADGLLYVRGKSKLVCLELIPRK